MQDQVEEIDLRVLLNKVKRYWWFVILLMMISGGLSYYVTKEKVISVYEARTTLFVGKENNQIPEMNLSDISVSNKLVSDYRELIKTNAILNQVIETLALDTTPDVIRKKINVRTVNDSRFIYVAVQDPSPKMAAMLADQLSEVLKIKAQEIIGAKNVSIVDYAVIPNYPIAPNLKMNVLIAMVLGIFISLLIILLNVYLDDAIEDDKDVEVVSQLTVLGVIPKFKGEFRR